MGGEIYANLQECTYAIWFYPKTIANNPEAINILFIKDPKGLYSPGDFLGVFVGTNRSTGFVNDTTADYISAADIDLNAWQHFAMTFSASGDKVLRVYKNGSEITYDPFHVTGSGILAGNDSADGFWIGNDSFDGGFDGYLAEFAVWNKQLSASEVSSVHSSGVLGVADGNLVGYWKLNGTGVNELDSSGHGNTAVVHGAVGIGPVSLAPASTGSRSFDGTQTGVNEQYIQTPGSIGGGHRLTLNSWLKVSQ